MEAVYEAIVDWCDVIIVATAIRGRKAHHLVLEELGMDEGEQPHTEAKPP